MRTGVLRTLKNIYGLVLYNVPEGRWKFVLRWVGFKLHPYLPRRALVNGGDTVVAAGCWDINTVIDWSAAVGESGTVVAVEADPTNAEIVDIEVRRRGLDNVIVVNKAIWDEATTVRIKVSELSDRNRLADTDTVSPLLDEDEDFDDERVVEADTLPRILDEVGIAQVDHIHMTISGAELEAINSMKDLLIPGTRIFVRSTVETEDGRPVRDVIQARLSDMGLMAFRTKDEPDLFGGNVYAYSSSTR